MENKVNTIFILAFCFIIVEPIPSPEDVGRYGAQPLANWQKNANNIRQHPNHPRPQSFYPTVNNNRNNNQDRSLERNYDNRQSSAYGSGDKRPFYEGINSRRAYNPSSTTASGANIREKSSFDAELPLYRSPKRHEYDERSNERNSLHFERQQPADRPRRVPKVPYQRSMSETAGNRYRDFVQTQRPSYFEKQTPAPNRPASPVNYRYPAPNRVLNTVPETMKSSLNSVRYSPPEEIASSQYRFEINKVLSQPKIQNYLASNQKRYLVLHTDGTVEHVDSLDSLVKNYPNYVMVKAGDIITNTKSSTLELVPKTPREDFSPKKIYKAIQPLPVNQDEFTSYGYNPRVPYVTEKAYAKPIDAPVNTPYEEDGISDEIEPVVKATTTSRNNSYFSETTTEYAYPTHFVETTTEYGTLTSLLDTDSEYGVMKPSITTTEYTVSIPIVGTTEDYAPYSDFTTQSASSRTPITVPARDETYTDMPLEILPEYSITNASLLVTSQDYTTLAPTTIIRNDEYFDNVMFTEKTFTLKEEPKNDNIPTLGGFYPTLFNKLIRQYFEPSLPVNKLDTVPYDKNASHSKDESSTNPFDVTDVINAITDLPVTSTSEIADVPFSPDDGTTISPVSNLIYNGTAKETPNQYYDFQTTYPESSSTSEIDEDIGAVNPFVFTNDDQVPQLKYKTRRRRRPIHRKTTESSYNVMANSYNNDPSELQTTTTSILNPFISLDEPYTNSAFANKTESPTETAVYNSINPFLENDTNPFLESTSTEIPGQRRRIKNKKRIKPVIENYSETNPFIENSTDQNVIPTERTPDNFTDTLKENKDESVLNPFVATNPFIEDLQNPVIATVGQTSNPFIENHIDDNNTLSPIDNRVTGNTPIIHGEPEYNYGTEIVPLPFLSVENGSYELTTKSTPDYHTISEDIDEVPATTEDVLLLTTTEKPSVWFKMDGDLWEKLSNGSVPYDVVYFFQLQTKPLVEKDAKTTIFPNGTIVQEFIETVWEREGDPAPLLVKSTKTVYPDEGS